MASAAVTSVDTATAPDVDVGQRHPRRRVGGAVGVADLRLAGADLGGEDQRDAVEVLLPAVRRGAGEVLVVDAEQLADRRRRDRSPRPPHGPPRRTGTPRGRDRRRAGVHSPGRGPRGECRVSSTASSRTTRAYAASRCTCAGRWWVERLAHHRHGRDGARLDVGDRHPPRVDGGPVDLDDPWLRGVGGHPGVVHDPHGVHVGRARVLAVDHPVRGADPQRARPADTRGRSPRGPRAPPRRRGAPRSRCRHRAASRARPRRSRARGGTAGRRRRARSRRTPRPAAAVAARPGPDTWWRSLGTGSGRYFVARARRRRSPGAQPCPGEEARPVVRQRQDGAGHRWS